MMDEVERGFKEKYEELFAFSGKGIAMHGLFGISFSAVLIVMSK